MCNFDSFIIDMCNEALRSVIASTPKTKQVTLSENLENMKPLEINAFIAENNIPDSCYFSTLTSCDYSYDYPALCWEVEIKCNDKDKLQYQTKVFPARLRKFLNDNCAKYGFYRKYAYQSTLSGKYYNFNFYKAFINKDIDSLISYFQTSFIQL